MNNNIPDIYEVVRNALNNAGFKYLGEEDEWTFYWEFDNGIEFKQYEVRIAGIY